MVVTSLPFIDAADTSEAGLEAEEPQNPSCTDQIGGTVWYQFTPTVDVFVWANTIQSNFDTVLAVYVGDALPNLVQLDCSDEAQGRGGQIFLVAEAGVTYYFQAGGYFDDTGELNFHLEISDFVPPANNPFPGELIDALPFWSMGDTTGAGLELGEPAPSCGPVGATVWYQFTPTEDLSLLAQASSGLFDNIIGVYVGGDLASLAEVGCSTEFGFPTQLILDVQAGETYFFQVGGFWGAFGFLEFHLEVTPKCAGRIPTLIGTAGDDILFGTPGQDVILGLGGQDFIRGFGGNDIICAGPDDDVVFGGPGKDRVFGEGGNDVVRGGDGSDRLFGNGGDDLLIGGRGDDRLVGGIGNDILAGSFGADKLLCGKGFDIGDGGPQVDPPASGCEVIARIP